MFPTLDTPPATTLRSTLPEAVEQLWLARRYTALYSLCLKDGMSYSEVWDTLLDLYPERSELKLDSV